VTGAWPALVGADAQCLTYINYLGSKYLQAVLIRKYLRLAVRTSRSLDTSSYKHLAGWPAQYSMIDKQQMDLRCMRGKVSESTIKVKICSTLL
jgi:hypothetical protein